MALFLKYKFLVASIIISLLTVWNLTSFGLPPTHDGEYHILRFSQFYKALGDGISYPRWAPDFNNGFGIPLFSYVYPLPNYIAAGFHFLGLSFINSFKLSMIVATILGAIFMYLWSKKYWGDLGGLVSSVFYTFSPYHLLDIYVRGSVGEVWSLGLFPGLLWSYLSFTQTKSYKYFLLSSLFLSLLILAHNILALIFFIFFLFYAAFLIIKDTSVIRDIRELVFIITIGLGLAAPFWLPALFEKEYVTGLQIFDLTRHFPEIYQLLIPSWGFGLSPNDLVNPMSPQIGVANMFVAIVALTSLFFRFKKIVTFFLAGFIIIFFLMTPYSVWIWQNIPFLSYFQFPWRLLSLEILISSFLAGSLVSFETFKKPKKLRKIVVVSLIIIPIALSLNYAKAPFYHQRTDSHYLTRSNFTDGTNSPGNVFHTKWLSQIPAKRKEKIEILKGQGTINDLKIRTNKYSFLVKSEENLELRVNTAFFPGWTVYVDNKKEQMENNLGKMSLKVPEGNHTVLVKLEPTPIQKTSNIYFLISVFSIIFIAKSKYASRN